MYILYNEKLLSPNFAWGFQFLFFENKRCKRYDEVGDYIPEDNPPIPGDNPPTPQDNPPTPGDNPPTPQDNPPTPGDNPPIEAI